MVIFKTQLFNDLQIGDMVWAKMPLPAEALELIEEEHRVRPYLVVSKDGNSVYGFQSSHMRRPEMNNYQTYEIDLSRFGYEKNSWIQLTDIKKIPIDNLRYKMFHLNDYDLNMIQKRLQIQQNRGKLLDASLNMSFKICKGDVVQYITDKKVIYYVHAVDGNKLISYPLSYQYRKHWVKIKINKSIFFIDFAKQVIIDIKDAKIMNIANNGDIGAIERKKKIFSSK